MNGDSPEINHAAGLEAVKGAVPIFVDNADVVVMAVGNNMYCSCLELVDMQIGLSCVCFFVLLLTGG
jgi:hypothetical protein